MRREPVFYKLFDVLLNEMKNSYPELISGKELIVETLKNEEEKFSSLLERGMKILDENLSKVNNKIFPEQQRLNCTILMVFHWILQLTS